MAIANTAKATPPSRKCLVAFTGSVTAPVMTNTVMAAEPKYKKFTKAFSLDSLNMIPILLSTR